MIQVIVHLEAQDVAADIVATSGTLTRGSRVKPELRSSSGTDTRRPRLVRSSDSTT